MRVPAQPEPYIIPARAASASIRDREALFARLLAVADVLATSLALLTCVSILGQDELRPTIVFALPLAIAVAKVAGLYDRDDNRLARRTLEEAPILLAVSTGYTLVFWLLAPLLMHGELGRQQVLGIWGSVLLLQLAGRGLARRLASRLAEPERCLVIGDGPALHRIARSLGSDPRVRAHVVAQFDLSEVPGDPGGHRPASPRLHDLARVISDTRVDRAIIAPGEVDMSGTLDLIRSVKTLGVKVSLVPRLFEVVGSSVEFDEVNGLTLLGVRDFGLTRSTRMIKRTFDVGVASVLLLLAAPLMTILALLIKLDSPGPVFFRQPRVGRGGGLFGLVKFRSMVDRAENVRADLEDLNETEGLFKIAGDPRITRVGRLMRSSSLDELPQLFNVLRGEMSIVGPRPLVIDDDRLVLGWDRRRLQLTPGMTGPWQVLPSTRVPLQEMVKIDYLYAANWSLWLDVKILLRTVFHVLGRQGL